MVKILLIEDEEFVRKLYDLVLTKANFEVIDAESGEVGLTLAQNQPDLIMLDLMLPGMNGLEVLKSLKADQKTNHIPVIILSNLGQDNIIKEALEAGAAGYLLKVKLNPYQIVNHIKEFLQNPVES